MAEALSGRSDHHIRTSETPSRNERWVSTHGAQRSFCEIKSVLLEPEPLSFKRLYFGRMDSETFSIVRGLPNYAGKKTAHEHAKLCLLARVGNRFAGL